MSEMASDVSESAFDTVDSACDWSRNDDSLTSDVSQALKSNIMLVKININLFITGSPNRL